MKFRTWHGEMAVVAVVLSGVASARGDWREWVAAAAVLATFGHASVAERMREREEARDQIEVDCVRWTWGYFVAKEVLWAAFFLLTGAYAALAGVGVFLAFPFWRRWWRRRHPLDRGAEEVVLSEEFTAETKDAVRAKLEGLMTKNAAKTFIRAHDRPLFNDMVHKKR